MTIFLYRTHVSYFPKTVEFDPNPEGSSDGDFLVKSKEGALVLGDRATSLPGLPITFSCVK
jgi:hypothetical protein